MDYKCLVIICILLSALLVQGRKSQGDRCLCQKVSKKLAVKKVVKLEIYPSSSNCAHEEYIATVKDKKKAGSKTVKKCISPANKLVQAIINRKFKKIKVINHPTNKD